MPIFPVAVSVQDSVLDYTLYAFCVEATNVDEAEGKANRIVRELHPKKQYVIKINSSGIPLEPGKVRMD